ncbi:hypothetical protein ACIQU2_27445 [Pseudomonas sp. NPDC098740]|uniref:hypothetical protein n=1 Tax=Pseudomonas sp. NPDC098740 TaxID=3364486 RepID=UPI00383B5D9F
MTISKKPKITPPVKDIDTFIQAAPDAVAKGPGVKKGNKVQISLTIDPAQLKRVDDMADELSMGRAGLINMAINNMLANGVSLARPKD